MRQLQRCFTLPHVCSRSDLEPGFCLVKTGCNHGRVADTVVQGLASSLDLAEQPVLAKHGFYATGTAEAATLRLHTVPPEAVFLVHREGLSQQDAFGFSALG